MSERKITVETEKLQELAINGGEPVRNTALPLEFPGAHHMDEEELRAASRVLRSRSLFRYYGLEPQHEVESFEKEFADFVGVRYAVAVSSGTGALHVALSALGVGPGQEIIVPAYLWVSIVAAVVNHGAIPVLADIDETFGVNPASVESRITQRTRGIIMAHMSGAPGDVQGVLEVARRHGLFLVEDCAQCLGGSVGGRRVGSFGDIGIFSFQMNKNMTAGEGGCVVTNQEKLYHRAVACHDVGYARGPSGRLLLGDEDVRLWGLGYRLDELRGAILRVQLRKLPAILAAMQRSKYRIRKALEDFPQVGLRRIQDPAGDTGCFLITIYRDPDSARRVNQALRAEGLVTLPQGTSNILMTEWGLHLYYNNLSLVERASADARGFPWTLAENEGLARQYGKGACPYADSLFARSILLAIPSCLTERDERDVIEAFRKVLRAGLAG